jgi:hypothetical protein
VDFPLFLLFFGGCKNLRLDLSSVVTKNVINKYIAVSDPGLGAFLTPGSGMGESQHPDPGSGMNNPDHIL